MVVAGDGVHDEHDHCHAYSDNGKKEEDNDDHDDHDQHDHDDYDGYDDDI